MSQTTISSHCVQTSYNSFIDLQDKLHQNLGRYVWTCVFI